MMGFVGYICIYAKGLRDTLSYCKTCMKINDLTQSLRSVRKITFVQPDVVIVCHHFAKREVYVRTGREGEVEGEDARFITIAWVTQSSPLGSNRELLQTFFWSPRAPSHSHCIWSLVYCNSLSLVPCLSLFPFNPPSLFPCSLPFICCICSLHVDGLPQFYCDPYSNASLSLFPSLLHTLCHSVGVIINDSLLSHFSCGFWHPGDIKSRRGLTKHCGKNILIIAVLSNCLNVHVFHFISLLPKAGWVFDLLESIWGEQGRHLGNNYYRYLHDNATAFSIPLTSCSLRWD